MKKSIVEPADRFILLNAAGFHFVPPFDDLFFIFLLWRNPGN